MPASFASLGAHRIRTSTLTIPHIGTWVCDLTTDDEMPARELTGLLTLNFGDLVLRGTVVRGEPWQGSTRARLVGGYGGWRRVIDARWYSMTAGVRTSIVARDAASACGETVGAQPVPDTVRGLLYTRPRQTAGRTLYDLTLPWYVLDNGATSLVRWPAGRVGTVFDVTGYDPARGIVTVASDSLAAWRPAFTFASPRLPSGAFVISDVVHHLEPGKIRTDLWVMGDR